MESVQHFENVQNFGYCILIVGVLVVIGLSLIKKVKDDTNPFQ